MSSKLAGGNGGPVLGTGATGDLDDPGRMHPLEPGPSVPEAVIEPTIKDEVNFDGR